MTTASVSERGVQWTQLARRSLAFLPILAAAAAFAHGFREPATWAATQLQFTCDLVPKRCAVGQALAWLHFPSGRYAAVSALSTVILALTIGLYGLVIGRSVLSRSPSGLVLIAALVGSYGTALLAAINGYLDIPLALLPLACILTPPKYRLVVTWATAMLGVLVHEAYLPMFLPVALLPMLLDAKRARDLLGPAAVVVSAVLLICILALNKPMPPADLQRVAAIIQGRQDFPIDMAALLVMGRSLANNLHLMARLLPTTWYQQQAVLGVAVFVPSAILFAWAVLWGLTAPKLAKLLVLAVAWAPLSLNVIGFDTWRWSALCIPTSLLALVVACERYGPVRVRHAPLFVGIALMMAPLPFLFPRPLAHPHGALDVADILTTTD
jgi:hypothetical protein